MGVHWHDAPKEAMRRLGACSIGAGDVALPPRLTAGEYDNGKQGVDDAAQ